ncbi:hypothetical protein CFHF_19570 [Caulobacter flavus]|uniref:DUF3768 domain-containing protein n=1 Tax=Caulobacter flavus TaxID=1679497 RepID=A0A2N5CNX8_9CAUL|nr:DUF3768 domain-containing protein [Caulobacter flavus]AYV48626.1 hypothetical protein C1707_21500 [Caulobacter flavus]PLR08659.1 hypothetical protein CFHF_19570 [Caulobacter flavus]
MSDETRAAAIAALNDSHRASPGAAWTLGRRLYDLGEAFVAKAVAAVVGFDAFTEGDDPYGERDFGAFDLEGQRVMWKIDYYDLDLCGGSPDPANPAVTRRVLTLILAEDY